MKQAEYEAVLCLMQLTARYAALEAICKYAMPQEARERYGVAEEVNALWHSTWAAQQALIALVEDAPQQEARHAD